MLCIIAVCIATVIIPVYRKRRDESIIQEETAKMREVLDQYETIIPAKLAERCEKAGFEIIGTSLQIFVLKKGEKKSIVKLSSFPAFYVCNSKGTTLVDRKTR